MRFFIQCYNIFYKWQGIGQIMYGLTALIFAKICLSIKDKNDLIMKLKRFKLLHTVSECKLLQKKTSIALQGMVETINAEKFIQFRRNCKKYERLYTQQKILVIDSLGTKMIGNIDGLSLKIHQNAINYKTEELYEQFIPSSCSIFKKLFLFIKHRLFNNKIIEKATGVSTNQYLTIVGEIDFDSKNNPIINVQQLAGKPQIFYQALNQEINQMKYIIIGQSLVLVLLVGAWACGSYVAYLRYKNNHQPQQEHQRMYVKGEKDIITENELCIACTTNARNTILMPCFHMILCQRCAEEVKVINKKCPFCRINIEQLKFVCIDNCLANIQESNMMMHELYCSRNVQICKTCGEKYDITEEDEHIQRYHIPKICKYCSQYVADPKQHVCHLKPVQCQYCNKQFKGNDIHQHEFICKHKEQKCKCCHHMIQNFLFKSHVPKCQIQNLGHLEFSCNNCGQILLSEQLLDQHEQICQQKQCPYCYFYIDEEDHMNLCGSRTEKCIFCRKIILLSNRVEHQLDCYRSRLKRNLKLSKKVSEKQQMIVNEQSEDADYQAYLEQIQYQEEDDL